jgi:uncharacterized protein
VKLFTFLGYVDIMEKFQRLISQSISEKLFMGKAIVLYGARQVGKTTLIREILSSQTGASYLDLNCDNPDIREALQNQNEVSLKALTGENKIVFIDEAQRVQNIGLTIKLFVDTMKDVQVIASGSSSFELANKINEPLTGRKYSFRLFPVSLQEFLGNIFSPLDFKRSCDSLLVYGSYPEVLSLSGNKDKEELISDLAGDALFKDIYTFQQIKNPSVLRTLLKALAFQVGSEVSSNELAGMVGIDKNTVDSYIDILEKNFIIVRIPSLSRNLRNELKKSKKIYFLDLGIRNAIINNFNSLSNRQDVGSLWENFCIVERLKSLEYERISSNNYFWRTYDGAEIDWIEERAGVFHSYEMKWNTNKIPKPPAAWSAAYKNSTYKVINPDTVLNLLVS